MQNDRFILGLIGSFLCLAAGFAAAYLILLNPDYGATRTIVVLVMGFGWMSGLALNSIREWRWPEHAQRKASDVSEPVNSKGTQK
jgi:hypothetical protein